MKNLLNLRNIIIVAAILFCVAGVAYKYYEWSTLEQLANLYNQTWTQEFGLVQNESQNSQPYFQLDKKIFSNTTNSGDNLIGSYGELTGDLQIIITDQEEYQSLLQQDNNAYANINTWFLIGKRGDFAKNLVAEQQQYYKYEIDDANVNDARYWLTYNVLTVLKDSAIITDFIKNTSSNPATLIPQNWSELSSLQKYTDPNFKFEHEDEIKKYYPNAYELLLQYQSYFSDFYSTMQNGDTGDDQSVAYELPALEQRNSSLNVNFADLYSETSDRTNNNSKNIIQIIANESNNIENSKSQNLFKYPLLPEISSLKDNLVLCQLYDFKSGLYSNLTTNYITATNPTALLNELSTIPPSTQEVDKKFDKSTMKLTNNKKQIVFTCIDKSNNTSYQFITTK